MMCSFNTAQWLQKAQLIRQNFLSLTAFKDRTNPVINVSQVKSGWDPPKSFYGEKTKILWAKYVTFTR